MKKKTWKLLKRAFVAGASAAQFRSDKEKLKEVNYEIHPMLRTYWENFKSQLELEEAYTKSLKGTPETKMNAKLFKQLMKLHIDNIEHLIDLMPMKEDTDVESTVSSLENRLDTFKRGVRNVSDEDFEE